VGGRGGRGGERPPPPPHRLLSRKGVLVPGKSLTIAALTAVIAGGLAAGVPAQASTAGKALHQRHAARPSAPSITSVPLPVAAQRSMLIAREHWLSEHAGIRDRAGLAVDLRGAAARLGHADGALTGVVRDMTGRPVAGACITATGPSGKVIARSRADGRYILPGLRSGQYAVSISNCATSATAAAETYLWPGLPAKVALGIGQRKALPAVRAIPADSPAMAIRSGATASKASTGGISGLVTGGGRPLKGLCAVAYPLRTGFGGGAVTSKAGRYHITGLKPGRYQVEFTTTSGCANSENWLDQWYPNVNSLVATRKVVAIRVKAGTTKTDINGHLKMGGEISGTVRTRAGKPLGHICIEVLGRLPGVFAGFGFRSGPEGRYVLHGAFPGRYTVAFSTDCTDKYVSQWWRLRTSRAHATPIIIKGTKLALHIDAALDRGATISGTVRAVNSSGKRLARICVSAGNRHDFASALTHKDGTYRLPGLAGGRYEVDFDPSCFGESSSNFLPQFKTVSVKRPRTRAGVNAFLKPGAGFSGVVKGPHGHPMEGICVQAVGAHGNAFAETDFDGSYSFGGLQAGSYTVQFAGCNNSGSVAPQYYNDEPTSGSADPITLTTGKITTGIDATMHQGAIITGVVTDAAGRPLSNVCVGVADQSEAAFGPDGFEDIVGTNAGKYRAVNLAPGQYQVNFGCGGDEKYASHWYLTAPRDQFPDMLSIPAGLTSGVDGVMRPGGSVAGVVTTRSGRPARAACTYLVDAKNGNQILSTVFQGDVENGRYKLTGLAPGTYKAFFYGCGANYASQWYHGQLTERQADLVRVRASHTTTGINASLAVGGAMSGQVVALATGKPVRNECVDAFNEAAQSFGFAQTDKTGHYTMHGLATGRYRVFFSRCYARGPDLANATRARLVHVTAPHTTTGINARLGPGASISGTVTGGAQPRPQIGTCIELFPLNPNGSFGFAETGIDGTYTATGLTSGQYQVFFNDPTCFFGVPSLASQWYNGQPTQATADIVTVAAGGKTTGVDATLQPFGTVSGTVTGPGQAQVSGECVTAVPIGKDLGGFFPRPREVAITTKSGSYSLIDVQPGKYKVRFSTGCGDSGFNTQWWQNAASAATATVITVSAGNAVTGIDAALTP
jgi:hypothetical protein